MDINWWLRSWRVRVALLAAFVLIIGGTINLGSWGEDHPGVATTGGSEPSVEETHDDRLARLGEAATGFGGMFYEPGGTVLNVYMLETTPAQKDIVRDAIGAEFPLALTESSAINVIQGTYSVTQLLAWYYDLQMALNTAGLFGNGGLAFTDMDDKLNRLTIKITDARFQGAVEAAAQAAGVPLEAVNIIIGRPPQQLKKITDKFRPLVGGIHIENPDEEDCTLGFNAKRFAVEGMVTASHCTSDFGGDADRTNFYQHEYSSSNRIGKETRDGKVVDCPSPWEGKKCRWSDAAFIQYNPGFDGDRGDIARTTGNGSRTIDDDNPDSAS